MNLRLGAALCVAVAVFAFFSSPTTIIKSGGIARGAAISRSLLQRDARVSAQRADKEPRAAVKLASVVDSADPGAGPFGATGIGAVIARAWRAGVTITGVASTYNPFRASDITAGGIETASGERYDPKAWTAAIQTDLRGFFGGVRFGKD